MKIRCIPVGALQTNCYLAWQEGSHTCVVIDPGDEAQSLLALIRAENLSVEAVFLTHGHFDHVGAAVALVKETGCTLWVHQKDWTMPAGYGIAQLFPLANRDACPASFYCHGQTVNAAGLTFTVWETPGHTWGSVCLLTENALFSGDTLFAGSIGRTDFPGSSVEAMRASLGFLKEQTGDYTVYPGHGEATDLAYEKAHNPFFAD